MHVGAAFSLQNPKTARTDLDVYREELWLADLAEPLGFESIRAAEHHFTDYTPCPDTVQFLTCAAGRTTLARLGTITWVDAKPRNEAVWRRGLFSSPMVVCKQSDQLTIDTL